ncbi:pyridoxal phosphate phosphatase PHOSPHO2-like [Mya arenaria]|uniref:pyridoxal phosphate phosphatase PHOSPHO2-like n=1 Tax=Mya arenaria TaxID=6604 RepID=UPI0022E733A3|nr:pyridoxal phosphate phosphatase PHOSPHO2-like [Mya arenaria]XP_052763818.1 pyridoxal phosphate phosphatase PHOSPHO2-like [Mya arenaria]XP_052763901.1 pyridoxal phosphate phosphatase PHOSPHO2-like [Mya arenaria]XP_052763971.1 pyridoxal phosphate phosphatase PHOSPHO2-like [Mya arenaria]
MSLKPKILVAFDFDHTVVDGNTDIEITKLCPEGKVPAEIKKKHKKTGWTPYMGAIFKFLKDHNISAKEMKETIQGIPLNEGMEELLKYLDNEIFEVIVISDSNSVFIDDSLEKHGFKDVIKTIYTNPAYYDESGLLHIEFYHTQDWCDLSTENLCKGHILDEHIKQSSTKFSHILYIGDGYNDLCPALRLNKEDYVFPRVGFTLWKKINKLEKYAEEEDDSEIRAKIVDWSSGLDILKVIEELCGKQEG